MSAKIVRDDQLREFEVIGDDDAELTLVEAIEVCALELLDQHVTWAPRGSERVSESRLVLRYKAM